MSNSSEYLVIDHNKKSQRYAEAYGAPVAQTRLGILINRRALWVGCHYSTYNRRLCINFIPCVTLWVVFAGGQLPNQGRL
jgi:hypothetical protein